MTLTIVFNEKSTQRINLSNSIVLKKDGGRKTPQEINELCKDIAHDISRGNYESIKID